MITRSQQILIKRAQRECALADDEYRDALEATTGCRSSRDAALEDRGVDIFLSYLEAIHWRKVDEGELQISCKPDAVFRQRGYWKHKNNSQETSRDRFTGQNLGHEIAMLESQLLAMGYGPRYVEGIRLKVMRGRCDPRAMHLYRAALDRTLRSKRRQHNQQLS